MSASAERLNLGTYVETKNDSLAGSLHINGNLLHWQLQDQSPTNRFLTDEESWFLRFLVERPNEPMMTSEVQLTAESEGYLGFKPMNVYRPLAKSMPEELRGHFTHFGPGKGGWFLYIPKLPIDESTKDKVATIAKTKVAESAHRNNDHPRQRRKREQVIEDYIDFLSGNSTEKFSKKKVAGAVAFIMVGTTVVWKLASHHSKDS